MTNSRQRFLRLAIVLGTVAIGLPVEGSSIPAALHGRWQGSGQIIVNGTHQKELLLNISILPSGRVTGRIGDAEADGIVVKRSAIMRRLGNGEYLIRASLRGPVIASEGIRRESLWL